MNIAVYSHYFTPEIGAPSARLYDMSREWMVQGHQVQVVTCYPNHPTGVIYPGYPSGFRMRETLDGIDVFRHWTYVTPNKGFLKKTLGHASFLPGARWLSDSRLAHPSITIGSSPTFFAAMAAARMARRAKAPFVMEVRDLWPGAFVELGVLKNRFLIRMLEKWEVALYRRADAVVTVTDEFKRNLCNRGIPPEKVTTITNGADENFWDPHSRHSEIESDTETFTVLYIGAHGISQALIRILEAAEHLKDSSHIEFLFVGEGAEKSKLMQFAAERALKNVRFQDPVGKEEVRRLYAASDVCLVPLRNIAIFDSFIPSKMFEMMAMECPIVASVRGEAASILQRSGSACVVQPENSVEIARAIDCLSKDRVRCAEMGRNGRKFVVDHYSRRALANKYLELMNSLIAGKKSSK